MSRCLVWQVRDKCLVYLVQTQLCCNWASTPHKYNVENGNAIISLSNITLLWSWLLSKLPSYVHKGSLRIFKLQLCCFSSFRQKRQCWVSAVRRASERSICALLRLSQSLRFVNNVQVYLATSSVLGRCLISPSSSSRLLLSSLESFRISTWCGSSGDSHDWQQ